MPNRFLSQQARLLCLLALPLGKCLAFVSHTSSSSFTPSCLVLAKERSTCRRATENEEEGTVLGRKYVLTDGGGEQSTSGKSTLVEATPWQVSTSSPTGGHNPQSSSKDSVDTTTGATTSNKEGQEPQQQRVMVKFSENIKALKREVKNYNKVTNEDTRDLFVEIHDFYNPCENETDVGKSSSSSEVDTASTTSDKPEFKGQAALVMEHGTQDLESYIRENGPLQGAALRQAVAVTARTVQACHDQNLVWTELKTANFVMSEGSKDNNNIKAIDLESAVPRGLPPIDFTPTAIPPEFALAYLCGREANMEMEPTFDIFSLGLLWYEMATGRHYWEEYFDEDEPCQIAVANELRLVDDCLPIDHAPIEEPLKGLIGECLRKDPEERPTIQDLISHQYIYGIAF